MTGEPTYGSPQPEQVIVREPSPLGLFRPPLVVGLPLASLVCYVVLYGGKVLGFSNGQVIGLSVGASLLAVAVAWMGIVVTVPYGISIDSEYVRVLYRKFTRGTRTAYVVPLSWLIRPRVVPSRFWRSVQFEREDGSRTLVLSMGLASAVISSRNYRGSVDDLQCISGPKTSPGQAD